jgi:hypothetical protein
MLEANLLEAVVIIVALGGLEVLLWWADHRRQEDQLATLEAIWAELATMNESQESHFMEPVLPKEASAPTDRRAGN